MSSLPEPFRFLSLDEFNTLTKDEKLVYLNLAAATIMLDEPVIGVIPPPRKTVH